MPKPTVVKNETNEEDIELSDGQIEVLGQLEESKIVAARLFNLKSPDDATPEMVFGVYDRVYDAFEDEEDEEDGDA